MRREHPFIGKTRDELDGKRWKQLGPSEKLLDFLKSRQTGPKGEVYYLKEIGYPWIRSRIPNAPPERTLKRWMGRLKDMGEITVRRSAYGMRIRLLRSQKWAQQATLFPASHPSLPIPVEKPVEITTLRSAKSGTSLVPKVAPKRSIEQGNRKQPTPARSARASAPVQNAAPQHKPDPGRAWRQTQKARRLLREIEAIREAYVGAYGDDLARRDYRLGLLYEELAKTGWQDARAG